MYVYVHIYICALHAGVIKRILCGLMKALDLQGEGQGQDEALDSGVLHGDFVAW